MVLPEVPSKFVGRQGRAGQYALFYALRQQQRSAISVIHEQCHRLGTTIKHAPGCARKLKREQSIRITVQYCERRSDRFYVDKQRTQSCGDSKLSQVLPKLSKLLFIETRPSVGSATANRNALAK